MKICRSLAFELKSKSMFAILLLLTGLGISCSSRVSTPIEIVPYVEPAEKSFALPIFALPIEVKAPFRKKLIVIDPGHGGEDYGTQSISTPPLKEKNLNLATAQMLEVFLQQMGYQTEMTRKNDTFVSLNGRVNFAKEKQADLFVSVHFNSAPAVKAEGIEVFYYRNEPSTPRSISSKALAEAVLKRVIINTDAKSRGVKHGNLAVVRNTTMPAILIEGGFFTNEREMQKLRDSAYIKCIAWGIAQGVQDFINKRH